jgi:hypothetical protein
MWCAWAPAGGLAARAAAWTAVLAEYKAKLPGTATHRDEIDLAFYELWH